MNSGKNNKVGIKNIDDIFTNPDDYLKERMGINSSITVHVFIRSHKRNAVKAHVSISRHVFKINKYKIYRVSDNFGFNGLLEDLLSGEQDSLLSELNSKRDRILDGDIYLQLSIVGRSGIVSKFKSYTASHLNINLTRAICLYFHKMIKKIDNSAVLNLSDGLEQVFNVDNCDLLVDRGNMIEIENGICKYNVAPEKSIEVKTKGVNMTSEKNIECNDVLKEKEAKVFLSFSYPDGHHYSIEVIRFEPSGIVKYQTKDLIFDSFDKMPDNYLNFILEQLKEKILSDDGMKSKGTPFRPRKPYSLDIIVNGPRYNENIHVMNSHVDMVYIYIDMVFGDDQRLCSDIKIISSFVADANIKMKEFIGTINDSFEVLSSGGECDDIEVPKDCSKKDKKLLLNVEKLNHVGLKVKAEDTEALDGLIEIYPSMAKVHHYLIQSMLVNSCSDGVFNFKPLLIVGPKGIGKTSFFSRLSKSLSLPALKIDFSGLSASFILNGSSSSWNKGTPGEIFRTLMKDIPLKSFIKQNNNILDIILETHIGIANPIIILDEIDKGSSSKQYDPMALLHNLLEAETSREFTDEFAGVPIDASKVNWVATANSTDGIPGTILDRFHTIELSELTKEEFIISSQSMFRDFSDNIRKPMHGISDECLESIHNNSVGLRDFGRCLYLSFEDHGDHAEINENKMIEETYAYSEKVKTIGF